MAVTDELSTHPAELHTATEKLYRVNGRREEMLYSSTEGGRVARVTPSWRTV